MESIGFGPNGAGILGIEVYIRRGLPNFTITGLSSSFNKDSRDRIRGILELSGFQFPVGSITIAIGPPGTRYTEAFLDLPISMAILLATEQISSEILSEEVLIVGNLNLDGSIYLGEAITPLLTAKEIHSKKLILPKSTVPDLELIWEGELYPMEYLNQVGSLTSLDSLRFHSKKMFSTPNELIKLIFPEENFTLSNYPEKSYFVNETDSLNILNYQNNFDSDRSDFHLFPGQIPGYHALCLALAGHHHTIFTGSPGAGKTMFGELADLLKPNLDIWEIEEILSLHGKKFLKQLGFQRPFRNPHHSMTKAGLIGGGAKLEMGEITLAHNGILFLDELGEIPGKIVQNLREPLEKGYIELSRNPASIQYPTRFLLLGTTNLCPCGRYSSLENQCICRKDQIKNYLGKFLGPFQNRIGILVELFDPEKVPGKRQPIHVSKDKSKIEATRKLQKERTEVFRKKRNFGLELGPYFNGELNFPDLHPVFEPDSALLGVWPKIVLDQNLNIRERSKILSLARTIADWDSSSVLTEAHILGALSFREGSKSINQIAA